MGVGFADKQTVAPSETPVSVEEFIAWGKIPNNQEIGIVESLLSAATKKVEEITGRQLCPATWTYKLDYFPTDWQPIELPHPPLISVTSIEYVDPNYATQTWHSSSFTADTYSEPGRVLPVYYVLYPRTLPQYQPVTITYTAGYPEGVPEELKTAIKTLALHWFQNREPVAEGSFVEVPKTWEFLLDHYRVRYE